MTCTTCSVIYKNNSWYVVVGSMTRGPYMALGMAIAIATNETLSFRRNKQQAKLSVENQQGEVRVEYCLCHDFKVRPAH